MAKSNGGYIIDLCIIRRELIVHLQEIALDPYLSLQKFIAMIEILPDYARVIDEGLYRAIDIYLKKLGLFFVFDLTTCTLRGHESSTEEIKTSVLPLVDQFYFSILTLLEAEIRFAYYKRLQRECILSLFSSSQNISARPYKRRNTNFLAAISATYCSGGDATFLRRFSFLFWVSFV
ncbi:hypothetical protein SO802_028310 [Lithocarpus litseifolius]|uniref:NPH3 domain-containing protein n=1 Tax=Lithocarpus litseifolius TaxID=425828 RepID=A0AAW2BQ68_9ROSI